MHAAICSFNGFFGSGVSSTAHITSAILINHTPQLRAISTTHRFPKFHVCKMTNGCSISRAPVIHSPDSWIRWIPSTGLPRLSHRADLPNFQLFSPQKSILATKSIFLLQFPSSSPNGKKSPVHSNSSSATTPPPFTSPMSWAVTVLLQLASAQFPKKSLFFLSQQDSATEHLQQWYSTPSQLKERNPFEDVYYFRCTERPSRLLQHFEHKSPFDQPEPFKDCVSKNR